MSSQAAIPKLQKRILPRCLEIGLTGIVQSAMVNTSMQLSPYLRFLAASNLTNCVPNPVYPGRLVASGDRSVRQSV